jgi:hypothetical protein
MNLETDLFLFREREPGAHPRLNPAALQYRKENNVKYVKIEDTHMYILYFRLCELIYMKNCHQCSRHCQLICSS